MIATDQLYNIYSTFLGLTEKIISQLEHITQQIQLFNLKSSKERSFVLKEKVFYMYYCLWTNLVILLLILKLLILFFLYTFIFKK